MLVGPLKIERKIELSESEQFPIYTYIYQKSWIKMNSFILCFIFEAIKYAAVMVNEVVYKTYNIGRSRLVTIVSYLLRAT